MFDPLSIPVYVNVRDRVRDLRRLVAWLEEAGHERIILIDNQSTWGPCREYLDGSPHQVVRLARNAGSRSIWTVPGLQPSGWFVYTDPDIVPTVDCPHDAVERLHDLLCRHRQYPKAGLGLTLEDVPAGMSSLAWEQGPQINGVRLEAGARDSMIDTTFALYRPGAEYALTAIRTTAPYVARHMPWYVTSPDAEDRYYLEHALAGPEGSSWASRRASAA